MPANTIIILLFGLLLASVPANTMDSTHEGVKVILQSDVQTIVITRNVRPLKDQLAKLLNDSSQIRMLAAAAPENKLKGDNSRVNKLIYTSLISNERAVQYAANEFNDLMNSEEGASDRSKRALEILGSFLSAITGVPSPQQHRKLMEQVHMIKIESTGIKQLLLQQNVERKGTIEALQLHETEIQGLDVRLEKLDHDMIKRATENERTAAAISVISKTQASLSAFRSQVTQIQHILTLATQNLLSKHAIKPAALSDLIDNIYLKMNDSTPVFRGPDCKNYYELPLTHSWVNLEAMEIVTLLQVPIANVAEHNSLTVLNSYNRIHPELSLAILNTKENHFRYLTQTELQRCTISDNTHICQKRSIRISPAFGCSIAMRNCAQWADLIVHDITNTDIIYMSFRNSTLNATLKCEGKQDKIIPLPSRAIITLALPCSLESQYFQIAKLSMKNMRNAHSDAIDMDISFDLDTEKQALQITTELKISQIVSNNTGKLEKLHEMNAKMKESIVDQIKISDRLWAEASGGQSPWDQIVSWSIQGTNFILTIILGIWAIYNTCRRRWRKGMKQGGEGGEDEQRAYMRELRTRIIDLESDLHANVYATK